MRWLAWCLSVVLGLLVLPGTAAAAGPCAAGNLLRDAKPIQVVGVDQPERLTDGWEAPDGSAHQDPKAVSVEDAGSYVLWDLGHELEIVAAALQADHDDLYRLALSSDGRHWVPLWQAPPVRQPGLQSRAARDLKGKGRFLQLSVAGGDGHYAATEVQVFCEVPAIWPPMRLIRSAVQENPTHTRYWQMHSTKLMLGVGLILLVLLVLPRLRPRLRRRAYWVLMGLGVLGWHNLGLFQLDGALYNQWDIFHYHLNAKYFDELGYDELYKCAARAERELGRDAAADAHGIRDLRDNSLKPGAWTRTADGACQAQFTPGRWDAFKQDVDRYHRMGEGDELLRMFADHGFVSPPLNTAWLKPIASFINPTPTTLSLLTLIDSAALIGAIALIYWGFGAPAAALFALVMGFGFPWGHHWLGGGLGRVVWLTFAAGGFALLKRDRPFWGAAALTVAAALRLFPAVFVGALGVYVLVRFFTGRRRLERVARQLLLGVAVSLALTTAAGGLVTGFSAYPEFAKVAERHSQVYPINSIGLPMLLAWQPGGAPAFDARLSDPAEVWRDVRAMKEKERWPLWLAAVLAGLALIVWASIRGSPAWQCAAVAGALMFAVQPLTSYDYGWLALLAPLAALRPKLTALLLGCVVFTQLTGIFLTEPLASHEYYSAGLLLVMTALGVVFIREQRALASVAAPAAPVAGGEPDQDQGAQDEVDAVADEQGAEALDDSAVGHFPEPQSDRNE